MENTLKNVKLELFIAGRELGCDNLLYKIKKVSAYIKVDIKND